MCPNLNIILHMKSFSHSRLIIKYCPNPITMCRHNTQTRYQIDWPKEKVNEALPYQRTTTCTYHTYKSHYMYLVIACTSSWLTFRNPTKSKRSKRSQSSLVQWNRRHDVTYTRRQSSLTIFYTASSVKSSPVLTDFYHWAQ